MELESMASKSKAEAAEAAALLPAAKAEEEEDAVRSPTPEEVEEEEDTALTTTAPVEEEEEDVAASAPTSPAPLAKEEEEEEDGGFGEGEKLLLPTEGEGGHRISLSSTLCPLRLASNASSREDVFHSTDDLGEGGRGGGRTRHLGAASPVVRGESRERRQQQVQQQQQQQQHIIEIELQQHRRDSAAAAAAADDKTNPQGPSSSPWDCCSVRACFGPRPVEAACAVCAALLLWALLVLLLNGHKQVAGLEERVAGLTGAVGQLRQAVADMEKEEERRRKEAERRSLSRRSPPPPPEPELGPGTDSPSIPCTLDGLPCVFPFLFAGRLHLECTTMNVDGVVGSFPSWCATSVDPSTLAVKDASSSSWGECRTEPCLKNSSSNGSLNNSSSSSSLEAESSSKTLPPPVI